MAREERRQLRRRHLVFNLPVYDADRGDDLGWLVDLTPRGLMVMGKKEIAAAEPRRLFVDTTAVDPRGGESFEVKAKSLWSRQSVNPELIDTGFAIVDPSPETEDAIERLIDALGFAD